MEIVETRTGDILTLAVHGRLDATSALAFEAKMLTHIDAGDRRVIVDLAELDYINSVGLRAFMTAAKHGPGGQIALCALRPSIRNIFDIAGLSTTFAVAATREEAATLLAS